MQFQNPAALFLLLLLIPVIWIGRPGRGYGRGREITALVLRCILTVLLALAAAELELQQGSDALAVVYLVDVSDSMAPQSREEPGDFISRALAGKRPEDQAAVVLFGAEALVERPMSPDPELGAFTSIPATGGSDLAAAVRLGMALFPPETSRRLVLLSDGRQTSGDAVSAARLAVQAGVEFLVVHFADSEKGPELTLLGVDLPAHLIAGEAFDLSISIHSREETTAIARVLAAGEVVFEGAADLQPGTQSFRIPLVAGETGFTPYVVQIAAAEDGHYQNNRLAAFTQVDGPPKVLVVAPPEGQALPFTDEQRPDESAALIQALEAAGFSVDLARPSGLPFELPLLNEYASVILVDVPAADLSNRQMEALQSYVRDLGGGLVAIGGPTSFGVGGYFRTPLEETLPVDMEIKDQERRPNLAMVFIIDHSGSMASSSSGATKLDLAKEAAIRSVELLFPGDRVGVIAFDNNSSWVVPINDLSDPDTVIEAIESIGVGGGTDILAGLQAMAVELPQDDALVKHVILLTDGGASEAGIRELVSNLNAQYGITLTTVGVGSDAAPFLKDIALLGGGRYHFTDRPESIPSIFTTETSLASRSYIVEEPFFPALAARSTIVAQIEQVPPLHGYVATSSKDTAQTILVSDKGDPILAAWQYGLGKAVAWTSDATSRWASDWVAWDGFPGFWAQAVRYTVQARGESPLSVHIEEGETGTLVTVEALTDEGQFLNNLALSVNIISPDGRVETLELPQTAPGVYQGSFLPEREGAYLLRFDGADPVAGERVSEIAGWVLSYSPEYRFLEPGGDILDALAGQAGARFLPLDQASATVAPPQVRSTAARQLWPPLLAAALLLLPLDIAVRRLALTRADFTKAWARLSQWRLQPAPARAGRSSQIAGLMRAKDRAAERRPAPRASGPEPEEPQVGPSLKPEPLREAESRQVEAPELVEARTAEEDGQPGSTTAALLASKRARDKKRRAGE